jgi:hypothetical protein
MILLYVLVSVSALAGVLNIVATVMLSNSLFRLLKGGSDLTPRPPAEKGGLVDPKPTPTYDPRFRQQK